MDERALLAEDETGGDGETLMEMSKVG